MKILKHDEATGVVYYGDEIVNKDEFINAMIDYVWNREEPTKDYTVLKVVGRKFKVIIEEI